MNKPPHDDLHAARDELQTTTGSGDLWLGLDTGGTYTDAVIVAAGKRIVATAKALTTKHDLALGLAAAIRAVVAALPPELSARDIGLVAVSTTLATNAVVERQRSRICAILAGYDAAMLTRSRLDEALAGNPIAMIKGGHHATGEQLAPLDLAAARAAILEHASSVEAFSVSSLFSVRNPSHERRIRELVRELTGKPVTCGHELTSRLDAPRRALTAALNAQLTPQLKRLIEAVRDVVAESGIAAPLMVVKGDGSLMAAEVALECPIETILSGPAASVVGAAFLTGLADFVVSDMGGTTTDIAIVRGGRPVLKEEGAVVGGWSTMVEAVDVRTYGLGGDSEIGFDPQGRLVLGSRRVVPLSLLATTAPAIVETLRRQAAMERLPLHPGRFALRQSSGAAALDLTAAERALWEALADGPRPLGEVVRGVASSGALRSLVARGLVVQAGLTPSDAMHVLGRQGQWDGAAARLGARIWAQERKAIRQDRDTPDVEGLCAEIHESVVRATGRVLYETLLAQDPGIEARGGSWGALGDVVIDRLVSGTKPAQLLRIALDVALPLVAIGGPVGCYYPEVAARLSARLVIPEYAAVSNAIGAVSGVVSHAVEVLVTQPKVGLFRVHAPDGNRDFRDAEAALAHAETQAATLASAAAIRAGAGQPTLETALRKKTAAQPGGGELLVEAVWRAVAVGRPKAALPVAPAER